MKKSKNKLIRLLIAVCALALCLTAVPSTTYNVQAATKAQEKKALSLIKGTWYTQGGMPYPRRVVFSGKNVKMYQSRSNTYTRRKIDKITKTSYGYYFRIPLGGGHYYGYRLYSNNKNTLNCMGNGSPYSSSGYSGTSSLTRHKY